jgi:hypothetical protein
MSDDPRVTRLVADTDAHCAEEVSAEVLRRLGGCDLWQRSPQSVKDNMLRGTVQGIALDMIPTLRLAVDQRCILPVFAPSVVAKASLKTSGEAITPGDHLSPAALLRNADMACDSWLLLPPAMRSAWAASYLGVGPRPVDRAKLQSFLEWFNVPLSRSEAESALAVLGVTFAPGVNPWAQTGPDAMSVGMQMANAIHLLQWAPFQVNAFPWQLPYRHDANIGGYYSLGDYFESLHLNWSVVPRLPGNRQGQGLGNWMQFSATQVAEQNRFFAVDLAALMVHEVRHTDPGGAKTHTCNSAKVTAAIAASNGLWNPIGWVCDPSFQYQGAWYVEWIFYKSLRDYTLGAFDGIRAVLDDRLRTMPSMYFCDPRLP